MAVSYMKHILDMEEREREREKELLESANQKTSSRFLGPHPSRVFQVFVAVADTQDQE